MGYVINHPCTNINGVHNYRDVIMGAMASQITSLAIVYSIAHSVADQRNCQSSEWLAFVRGIHPWTANSPHKGPATREMFPFDDVTMWNATGFKTRTSEFTRRKLGNVITYSYHKFIWIISTGITMPQEFHPNHSCSGGKYLFSL